MTAGPLLSVEDLRVWYATTAEPVRAVDGVSLEIKPGEAVGLIGETGCGKSTLARAILDLLTEDAATSGRVVWRGRDLVDAPPEELRRLRGPELGLVFQEPMTRLDPLMTIEGHFHEMLATHAPGLRRAERRERSLDALSAMGLPAARLRQYPHELSGGMRQRITIALATLLSPMLLVADEPTTALDVIVEAEIVAVLAGLRERTGGSLLLITHNLGIVAETCDRVAVMYAGRIVEEGPTPAVLDEPAHPYTRALLRSTVTLATTKLEFVSGAPPDLSSPPPGCRFHPRCPNAMPVCAERDPIEIRRASRRVSCWLHDET